MNRSLATLLTMVTLLAACVPAPKTAGEFRAMMKSHANSPGVRVEHFQVNRPYKQVTQFVKTKSNECLKASIRWSERSATSASAGIIRYQPYASISANKAEIYAVETYMSPRGEPRGDKIFTFLADFAPAAGNKTKVDLYYTWGKRTLVAKAVKAWAEGDDVGCPNLAS